VEFEGKQLTYRELNERANQLAHYLRAQGVGAETLVGICMERCLEMVVGLLGVLKAGAAYVPLDPAYPKERLAFMVEDAQVGVLLTGTERSLGLPKMGPSVRPSERQRSCAWTQTGKRLRGRATRIPSVRRTLTTWLT